MSELQNSNVHTGEEDEDVLSSQTSDIEENLLVDTSISIEVSNNDSGGILNIIGDGTMSEISLDQNQLKKADKVIRACYLQQWHVLEYFLSNDDISLEEKKNILHFENNSCLNVAFGNGAPLNIVKALVDIEGKDVVVFGTEDQPPWLHVALMVEETPFEVIKFYVDLGGKKLLHMKSNFYNGGNALHFATGGFAKQEIIELLLRVGGLELLDIPDGGGFRIIDYCDTAEREAIVNSLISIEKKTKLSERDLVASLEHRKRFSSSSITPREMENWIHQGQLDLFRDYFNNTNVSKAEKIRCLNYRDVLSGRNLLHTYSSYCYPVDIVSCIVNLMDEDYLFYPDDGGNTCLHLACTPNIDQRKQLQFANFLIDNAGTDLIHVVNGQNKTALHKLISSYCLGVMNLDLIKMMIENGDDDLLLVQDSAQCSVLHYISMYALVGQEPNKELLLYFVSKGGRKLRDLTDDNGKKAEDYWTDDVKEYINLSTNTLPSLSDDIQCPICFDTMFDVSIIPQCCHRFCRKCISESYHRSGNNCPSCRMEFSFEDVRKDPLLSRFASAIQEEKDAKNRLEEEVKALR